MHYSECSIDISSRTLTMPTSVVTVQHNANTDGIKFIISKDIDDEYDPENREWRVLYDTNETVSDDDQPYQTLTVDDDDDNYYLYWDFGTIFGDYYGPVSLVVCFVQINSDDSTVANHDWNTQPGTFNIPRSKDHDNLVPSVNEQVTAPMIVAIENAVSSYMDDNPIDSALSSTSTNAVQNAAITAETGSINAQINVLRNIADTLYSSDNVSIGINWTGTSASDKAVEYIAVKPSTNYYISVAPNNNIQSVTIIAKASNIGASRNLKSTTVSGGNSTVFCTTSDTHYLCLQFNGSTTITETDFNNYIVFVIAEDIETASAHDYKARNQIHNIENGFKFQTSTKIDVEQGYWAAADGLPGDSNNWCRVAPFIDIDLVIKSTTMKMFLQAYDALDGTYIGTWNRSAFSTTYDATSYLYYFVANDWIKAYPSYQFRISFTSTGNITPSDVLSDITVEHFTYNKIEIIDDISELIDNLVDPADFVIGKDYTGGTNSKRAVVYVPVSGNTTYYLAVPKKENPTNIIIVEKASNTGASPAIHTSNFRAGTNGSITTDADTRYLCLQANSTVDITSAIFENYALYLCEGNTGKYSAVDRVARNNYGIKSFDTLYDLARSEETGISRVGGYVIRNIKNNPEALTHTQNAHSNPYYDVNSTIKEYQVVNCNKVVPYENILNDLPQEEIDFTPSSNGFTRIVVGKDDNDLFFVAYVASNRVGAFGDGKYDTLEVTSDFVTFRTILRSDLLATGDGIVVPNMTNIKVVQVKQFSDGTYLVAMKSHNISENNDRTHFYKLSKDMQTITHMQYVNFNNETVDMTDEFGGDVYDWSVFAAGAKAIATTYGNRQPETDYGRVWYTEDCGTHWKQVFQTNNHYQDGQAPGVTVTYAHTHGVMIDPYSDRLFVIVGEANKNIFWSDKGYDTTDSDWNVISLATSAAYNFQDSMQVVNGYPFPDSLVFGSDSSGVGCVYRLNKMDDGGYSYPEAAHEFLPNEWNGVYYCAADLSRRNLSSPLFMCETHESARFTEANNELLNELHKARVVATYDGINFTEVWTDDTYGAHNAYIDGQIVSRNYSWCTRGMNCWLLNNGDAVIKYANRDYYYFGGEPMFSVSGISNGSCKVRWIKNAEKYL